MSNSCDSSSERVSWPEWWCSLRGNEFLLEIGEDFLRDRSNLIGLDEAVLRFKRAYAIITDCDTSDTEEDEVETRIDDESAAILYGLIHARYVMTSLGMSLMGERFRKGHFGKCPRTLCKGQHCLPVGVPDPESKVPHNEPVKLYCPACRETYSSRKSHEHIKGVYFGSFPHVFFLTFPNLRPEPSAEKYTETVYGFKIHPSAFEKEKKAITTPIAVSSSASTTNTAPVNGNQEAEPVPHCSSSFAGGRGRGGEKKTKKDADGQC